MLSHSIEPRKIPSSGSLITTGSSIAFDNKFFLSETLVKTIRDDNELKNSQRRHSLINIVGNNSKRLLLYGTQNKTKVIAALVVKYFVSKNRKI